ncbi:MAG: hypothetical protein ACRBN8_28895 [Nannocystales bacterium]
MECRPLALLALWSLACGDPQAADDAETEPTTTGVNGASSSETTTTGPIASSTTGGDGSSSTGEGSSGEGRSTTSGLDDSSGDSTGGTSGSRPPSGTPVWVAVGARRYRAATFDGETWDEQTHDVAGGDADLFRGVGWGNGTFVAVGGSIARSTDGLSWEEDLVELPAWFGGVAYGNDRWVITGGNGRHLVSTDDAETWGQGGNTIPFPSRAMAFGAGVFVSVGDSGGIATSTDGVTWTDRSEPIPTGFRAVAYGAGTWVVNGRNYLPDGVQTACLQSQDAEVWTPCAVRAAVYEGTFAANDRLFIVHDGGYASTLDGVTWSDVDVSVPATVFEAGERWVGADGVQRFSGDGLDSMASVAGSESARALALGYVETMRGRN